jgi:hypothetical protein
VPVYRLFHPTLAKHLYTVNPMEWETAITRDRYIAEGVVGYLYADQVPGTVPLYRLYHFGVADHFYTNDPLEVDLAVAAGYVPEAIIGYVPAEEDPEVWPS